jgi:D-3-phosphoglycerate dehydrogenase / 2-oxoglutarate reductase
MHRAAAGMMPRMNSFNVLVTGKTVSLEAQKLLEGAGGKLTFMSGKVDEQALLTAFNAGRVDAVLLRASPPFTPAVFAAAPHLRIISKYGAGTDSVDMASANARGIAVMVANGANADAVAEHSLALMLCVSREIWKFDRGMRAGAWKDLAYVVRDFKARTVGIVGYGQIGRRTAKLVQACGAHVVVHSRSRKELPAGMEWEEDFDRLLTQVDILSLHTPLTDKTRNLVGERELKLMKADAIIVNTGRGKLIDEPALIAALSSGRLAAAGLDTFATEPVDPQNPLFALPNVVCTPHIASSTTDAAALMGKIAANNIISYLRGEVYDADNFLNPQVFSKSS